MILNFPSELIFNILIFLEYKDLISFLSTCKQLNDFQKDFTMWVYLLRYCYKTKYYETHKRIGPKRMFYEATLSEPIYNLIKIKHYNFMKYIPDYSYSYSQIALFSEILDKSHIEILIWLVSNDCKELENYFLDINGPDNYIINRLSSRSHSNIRYLLAFSFNVESLKTNVLSTSKLEKLIFFHKLDKKFIPPTIKKIIFLSCLYNANKNVLQYFMDENILQSYNITSEKFKDFLPYISDDYLERIVDFLEYLYQFEFPNKKELFSCILLQEEKILQKMYEKKIILLQNLDELLLLSLCTKYIKDGNIEEYLKIKKELKLSITGTIIKVDGCPIDFNAIPSDYTIKLSLVKDHHTHKLYRTIINLLFELLNDPEQDSINFAKKLDLKDLDIIAILAFNTIYKRCDNIVENHYELLTSHKYILNLVFPNCNKLVAISLLKKYIPPQNVINYCAINITNIALLQEKNYFQDKITNDKMKKCMRNYDGYLLKSKWKFW